MGGNRNRISLTPLRSIPPIRLQTSSRSIPPLWTPIADIERGDGSGGLLIQHKQTQIYALWTGVGSIETLPQHKVAAALAEIEWQTIPQET